MLHPRNPAPSDLALPEAIARAPRLDLADWQLREVSITQPVRDENHGMGFILNQVADGLPVLEATLLPLTPAALQAVEQLSGQCFLLGSHLFRISHGDVTVNAGGMVTVWIHAPAIWRQPPEQDSHTVLPAPSLP